MRRTRLLLMTLAVVTCAVLSASDAVAQTWWVQSADYGAGNQRQDVTNSVRRLVTGPNFKVNNDNLGGDPAKGKDKTLRIVAKDANGKIRDFYYKEGQMVPSQTFAGGFGSGRPLPGSGGGGSTGGSQGLRITSAKWGLARSQQDVTSRLQGMVRNNGLTVLVNPQTMGGDPSPGYKKMVTVFYSYGGRSLSKVVSEGGTLSLP
jgi:hypothetical protein